MTSVLRDTVDSVGIEKSFKDFWSTKISIKKTTDASWMYGVKIKEFMQKKTNRCKILYLFVFSLHWHSVFIYEDKGLALGCKGFWIVMSV